MEFVEVRSRRSPPKPRSLYRVALVRVYDDGTSEILGIHETWAVSEKQAASNVRYRLGRRNELSEIGREYYQVLKDDEQPSKKEIK
jgi:hypothetical protein